MKEGEERNSERKTVSKTNMKFYKGTRMIVSCSILCYSTNFY